MSTAGNERGLSLRSPGRFCAAADRLVDAVAASGGRAPRAAGPRRRRLGRAEAYRLYTWGTVTRLAAGGDSAPRAPSNKVFWSELDIALHETALDLLGPDAELRGSSLGRTATSSRCPGPIYAGTNEIQRNIVAERLLGLPREVKGAGR